MARFYNAASARHVSGLKDRECPRWRLQRLDIGLPEHGQAGSSQPRPGEDCARAVFSSGQTQKPGGLKAAVKCSSGHIIVATTSWCVNETAARGGASTTA